MAARLSSFASAARLRSSLAAFSAAPASSNRAAALSPSPPSSSTPSSSFPSSPISRPPFPLSPLLSRIDQNSDERRILVRWLSGTASLTSFASDPTQLKSAREDIKEFLKTKFCHPILVCNQGIPALKLQFCNFSKGKKKVKSDGSDSGEENMSKKDLALHQALDQIIATFGKGSIMWLGRTHIHKEVPVVSTGSFSLDIALGIGGFPKGRVIEIYGPEASGKTTLALHVIAEAQKSGGYCAFIDAEHALDPVLAEAIGVKTENLLLSQPDCGEQALSLVDTLVRSGSVDVVVVDSVAALVPKTELDGEMGDAHVALQARLMSQALRKLSHSLSLSQTTLVFINQVRSKVSTFGGGFGGPTEVTSGGNALKFYASVRLNIRRIGLVKKGEETIGSQVLVKIVKNKHAPPFKTAQFELEFGKGISRDSEIIELGCKHKFIAKAGGAFYNMNGQSFRGKDAIKRYFTQNEGAREELMVKLREKLMLSGRRQDEETETPDPELSQEVVTSDATDEDVVIAVEA